jgi:hypothetical protein
VGSMTRWRDSIRGELLRPRGECVPPPRRRDTLEEDALVLKFTPTFDSERCNPGGGVSEPLPWRR